MATSGRYTCLTSSGEHHVAFVDMIGEPSLSLSLSLSLCVVAPPFSNCCDNSYA